MFRGNEMYFEGTKYIILFERNDFEGTKYIISFPQDNIFFTHTCPLRGSILVNIQPSG